MLEKKWFDWGNMVLGIWLVISPWLLGFSATASVLWSTLIVGLLVIGISAWGLYQPEKRYAEWINMILGVLLFIAPWGLGFTTMAAAAWNAWILGVLVALISVATFLPQISHAHHQLSH